MRHKPKTIYAPSWGALAFPESRRKRRRFRKALKATKKNWPRCLLGIVAVLFLALMVTLLVRSGDSGPKFVNKRDVGADDADPFRRLGE